MKNDKVPIYNPINKDITIGWDLQGENPKNFKLVAKEITFIDKKYEDHVRKHIVDEIFEVRGDYKKDQQVQRKDFEDETRVEI